jgi:hypothetical protein
MLDNKNSKCKSPEKIIHHSKKYVYSEAQMQESVRALG